MFLNIMLIVLNSLCSWLEYCLYVVSVLLVKVCIILKWLVYWVYL